MKRIRRCHVLIAVGVMLLIAAAVFEARIIKTDKNSRDSAQQIVRDLKEVVNETGGDDSQTHDCENTGDDFVVVEGSEYYGILSIPTLDVELPVSYSYSYEQMSESLCRYYGSIEENNLIICGHNYKSFLQNLGRVNEGDSVFLVDSKGVSHSYVVNEVQLIGGYEHDKLIDDGTDWDLSVFTCNYSGYSRYVLRCKTVE